MGFIAIIFCIFIVWFMGYLVYHQFIAPVKNIIEASEKKKKAELIAEKIKIVLKDKIFLERIAPIKKALENNEITNERFEEIFIELFKERTNEMFKKDEDFDDVDFDDVDFDDDIPINKRR